jgi:RimJ/RimL family protein N-acetyltransferase
MVWDSCRRFAALRKAIIIGRMAQKLSESLPMSIPVLETPRLRIREYTLADLQARHELMRQAFQSTDTLEQDKEWLNWTILNYRALANLYQPPYGDYVIELKLTGEAIGSLGLVPTIVPWGVLTERPATEHHYLISPEFGLFWAVLDVHQGYGYATEAAKTFVDYIFKQLFARRIVATTESENLKSQNVMKKIGMSIHHNPSDKPFWFKTIGVLENPLLAKK